MISNQKLLENAIEQKNLEEIELILNKCKVNELSYEILTNLFDPYFHEILKKSLEHNENLRDIIDLSIYMYNIKFIIFFNEQNNFELINILITHLPENGSIFFTLCISAIMSNNIKLIKLLCELNHDFHSEYESIISDIKFYFDEYNRFKKYKINLDTFVYLEQCGFEIFKYYKDACKIFTANDSGVEYFRYFIDGGVNANDILHTIYFSELIATNSAYEIIKLLLENGADPNLLTQSQLLNIVLILHEDKIFELLIECGFKPELHIHELLIALISECKTNHFEYIFNFLIEYNLDIHHDDDILLRHGAFMINTDCVKILLNNNANIRTDNDTILSYVGHNSYEHDSIRNYSDRNHKNAFEMVKMLMDYGAIVSDPNMIFYSLLNKKVIGKDFENKDFKMQILKDILDYGIDFKNKFNIYCEKKYILESCIILDNVGIFKLCIDYGADTFVANNIFLKLSIKYVSTKIIKLLLDVGAEFNYEWEIKTTQSVIDLLLEYEIINHKLYLK